MFFKYSISWCCDRMASKSRFERSNFVFLAFNNKVLPLLGKFSHWKFCNPYYYLCMILISCRSWLLMLDLVLWLQFTSNKTLWVSQMILKYKAPDSHYKYFQKYTSQTVFLLKCLLTWTLVLRAFAVLCSESVTDCNCELGKVCPKKYEKKEKTTIDKLLIFNKWHKIPMNFAVKFQHPT